MVNPGFEPDDTQKVLADCIMKILRRKNLDLDIVVKEDVIAPAGISIEPSLHVSSSHSGVTEFYFYPLGDKAGSPDFRLDILPTFDFRCEGGSGMQNCLMAFARKVLAPLTILIAGLSTGGYILGLGIHARQMRLRGRELAKKLATLLDAQPLDAD